MRTWLLAFAVLLAGCAQTDDSTDPVDKMPGGGNSLLPQTGHDEDTDPEGRGLRMIGDFSECEEVYCFSLHANNDGPDTYYVSDICVTPWAESMTRDGEAVYPREPMAHCAAFGTKAFPPGASMDLDLTWDGNLWNDAKQAYEDAPEGAYEWRVTFTAYDSADGEGVTVLGVAVTVLIGYAT